MSHHRKKLITSLVAFLMLFTLVAMQGFGSRLAHAATTTITVYPSQQYQDLQGWGTSLAWWANIIGGWSNTQRSALADALYDPNKGIGLNVVRYNFGADGPGNVCHNQISAGRNVPSFEPTQGNYVWTNDANQLWFAQAAQARGANIFEGFVNSAPAWMLLNSCTAGGNNGGENLNPADYTTYASYLATIDQHFHDSFGITFQTIEPFNEPVGTGWSSTDTQEGMRVFASNGDQNTIIKDLGAAMASNGTSAYSSIAAPDDVSMSDSIADYNTYDSTATSYLSQWNTHAYGQSNADRTSAYTNIGQKDHKTLWMSEWGTSSQGSNIGAGLALSNEILDDEEYLHPSVWVAWQAVNEVGDASDDLWGLAYRDSNNNITYPSRYYAMGNYSKFIRNGYQMIGNSDSNTLTAYNAGSKTLVIVATNNSTSSEAVTYNLANFSSVGTTATPYQTSASENLAQLSNVSISNNAFSTSLPGQSITTFVIPNVSSTGSTFGGLYKFVNHNSNMVLEDPAFKGSGTQQDQWSDNGGTNQHWNVTSIGSGYYEITNDTNGLALDVSGGSTGQGTAVVIDPYTGSNSQQWSIQAAGNGYYYLVNRNSGDVVDVSGASTSQGAPVIQWPNHSGTNQQWLLESA